MGIDAREGKVATRGWLETSEVMAVDLAKRMGDMGAAEIIYTDIKRDGTLQGPNIEALRELATAIDTPVIASGGVSAVSDLLKATHARAVWRFGCDCREGAIYR